MHLVRWQSAADYIVLAGAIYLVLGWAKQARAVRIALGIIGLQLGALLARNYDLPITSWVLSGAGFLAVVVLLVIFQPELRHALMRLDTVVRSAGHRRAAFPPKYRAISEAAFDLAQARVGALIVLIRGDSISELMQDGTKLGAAISRELIAAIFQKTSPLHDGAVVISGQIIERARAVLPLTHRPDVPPFFGTRHRAAMGLAERSDALVIAVSEERGTVTLIEDRKIREMRNSDQTAGVLELLETKPELGLPVRLRRAFTQNLRFKFAAAGLAAAVWAAAFYTGTTVRTVTVPVAFSGVPAGMNIAAQSVSELEVQIRGNPLMMDSASLERLVATFDLGGGPAGQRTVRVRSRDFDLPPGIHFVRASPAVLSVRLVRPGP
jgi:diadenylate cyclase